MPTIPPHLLACLLIAAVQASAQKAPEPDYPPVLRKGKTSTTVMGSSLVQHSGSLREGITVAKIPPKVHFLYYPGQDYRGNPWSVWGDGSVSGGIYYSAIGDHLSPGGNAMVYAYDPATLTLRKLTDVRSVLKRKDGEYTPGKIHSRVDLGSDGWLYYSTHRGSTKVAFKEGVNFKGDHIYRHHPQSGKTEIVAEYPVPMHTLPTGQLDAERLIWYAGSNDGLNKEAPKFLAWDIKAGKPLFMADVGPARAMIHSKKTGRVYFVAGKPGSEQPLLRFDPADPKLVPIEARVGLRCATEESRDGKVYTIDRDALWVFDTATEKATHLGECAVASQTYTASVDLCPQTERYLYYVPGAHGGGQRDGTPIVQYDLKTNQRKVIAFLHPIIQESCSYIPMGTYATALSAEGDKLFITWNGNRGVPKGWTGKTPFNTCALTVIHIPESERQP